MFGVGEPEVATTMGRPSDAAGLEPVAGQPWPGPEPGLAGVTDCGSAADRVAGRETAMAIGFPAPADDSCWPVGDAATGRQTVS